MRTLQTNQTHQIASRSRSNSTEMIDPGPLSAMPGLAFGQIRDWRSRCNGIFQAKSLIIDGRPVAASPQVWAVLGKLATSSGA